MCHHLSGKDGDSDLSGSIALISSSAKAVDELITGLSSDGTLTLAPKLPCLQSVLAARDELHSALHRLYSWSQAGQNRSSAASDKSTEDENITKESRTTHSVVRNRVIGKVVYTLAPGVLSKGSTHWV